MTAQEFRSLLHKIYNLTMTDSIKWETKDNHNFTGEYNHIIIYMTFMGEYDITNLCIKVDQKKEYFFDKKRPYWENCYEDFIKLLNLVEEKVINNDDENSILPLFDAEVKNNSDTMLENNNVKTDSVVLVDRKLGFFEKIKSKFNSVFNL